MKTNTKSATATASKTAGDTRNHNGENIHAALNRCRGGWAEGHLRNLVCFGATSWNGYSHHESALRVICAAQRDGFKITGTDWKCSIALA